MKKRLLLVICLVFVLALLLSVIYPEFKDTITGDALTSPYISYSLASGESITINDIEIKVNSIGEKDAKFLVDGETYTLSKKESLTLEKLIIKLNSIDEEEIKKVSFNIREIFRSFCNENLCTIYEGDPLKVKGYELKVEVDYDNFKNETNIQRKLDNSWVYVCKDKEGGEVCSFEDLNLDIKSVEYYGLTKKYVILDISGGGIVDSNEENNDEENNIQDSDNENVSEGLFQRIINWFKDLF